VRIPVFSSLYFMFQAFLCFLLHADIFPLSMVLHAVFIVICLLVGVQVMCTFFQCDSIGGIAKCPVASDRPGYDGSS
jgi:hypothetical protein